MTLNILSLPKGIWAVIKGTHRELFCDSEKMNSALMADIIIKLTNVITTELFSRQKCFNYCDKIAPYHRYNILKRFYYVTVIKTIL